MPGIRSIRHACALAHDSDAAAKQIRHPSSADGAGSDDTDRALAEPGRKLDLPAEIQYNVISKRHEGIVDKPLTTQEAAAELGYSVRHLYRLLDDGTIQGERFGHVWMIDRQEVERIKALQGPGGRLPKSEPKQS